ncbi:uncharacterized protein [Primulina huaijiensis]|uniref:uncharacterized protein n=1 Tax=Primulina huaijiensis TaxID=1492673 RepID=UPI003CC6DFC1
MAATASTRGCETTIFFRPFPPTPPAHKFPSSRKQFGNSNLSLSISQLQISSTSTLNYTFATSSVSSPETPVVVEEGECEEESGTPPSVTGCPACGKKEIENGCNGEGRIQGGIATVPGFGWWPIKAYRPCPDFVASGGRYRRSGQSMDEVVSGSGRKGMVKGK